ncbi:MAG: MFS transporter [Acidobacteriota bacterium]
MTDQRTTDDTPLDTDPAGAPLTEDSPAEPEYKRGMGLFTIVWSSQVLSLLGSMMTAFALGVEIFENTRSVTRYALIALSVGVPVLLLSPFAGVLVDRWDRRKLMITARIGAACTSLALLYMVQTGNVADWNIYPLVALSAAFNSFVLPAFGAVITTIVPKRQFSRAAGMNQVGFSMTQIVAPLLAGWLVVEIGLRNIILLDFSTFLISISVLLLVRFPKPKKSAAGQAATGGVRQQTGFAWAFLREHKGLFMLLVLFAILNFATGMVVTLITPLILSFASAVVLGVTLAVASSGTLVGGIVMSVWGGPKRKVATILAMMLVQGLVLLLGGLEPNAALIATVAFFFLATFPVIGSISQSIWQSKIPEDMQGRIFALRRMIAGSSVPFAQAIAGPLADWVFEPALQSDGFLAGSVGQFIGTGPGRGIGFMLMLLGVWIVILVISASRVRGLRRLETDVADEVEDDDDVEEIDVSPSPFRHLRPVAVVVLTVVLVGLPLLSVSMVRPPTPLPADAAADEFSAARALEHIAVTGQTPHPIGSTRHAEVRAYLVEQLRELGLEVEIQEATSVTSRLSLHQSVRVHNVVARLPGTEGGPAVLLAAHYDSVPTTRGASDNQASVSTLLETARALTAGEPLRHDVIVLLPDAEETGLHGARVFLRKHRWAGEIGVVINFDARGRGGPSYMFETGDENGVWIPEFIAGASDPRASSLTGAIYEKLPNDTDFRIFREAGMPGFNLAFINGLTHYHSMLDRPEDLSPASIQHHGSYALSLTRHFADLDLAALSEQPARANQAYFNVLGNWMVFYPRWVAGLSAVVAIALFVLAVLTALRRRVLRGFPLWQAVIGTFGIVVAVPVFVTLIWLVVRDSAGVSVIMGSTIGAHRYMIAFLFLGIAVAVLMQRFFRSVVNMWEMAIGAAFWWLIAVLFTSGWQLPMESNFLAVWPLIGALVTLNILLRFDERALASWKAVAVLVAGAVPGLLLVPPFTKVLYVGLQTLMQLGGVALLPAVLLIVLLVPLIDAVTAHRPKWLPTAAGVLGVGWLIFAVWNPGADGRLWLSSVTYTSNLDTDEHAWFTFDPVITDWTEEIGFDREERGDFKPFFPFVLDQPRIDAPAVDLHEPELEVLSVEPGPGGTRYVRVRFHNSELGRSRLLILDPPDAFQSAELDGEPIALRTTPPGRPRILLRHPLEPGGHDDAKFRIQSEQPVRISVVDQLEGIPDGLPPRPDNELPRPLAVIVRTDISLVRKTFEIDPSVLIEPASVGETIDAAPAVPEPVTPGDDETESTVG